MASPGQSESFNIQLLVDSIPALIHTARPDGFLDYFNKPWLEYLGVTLDRVIGWNWTAFVHPEDVEGIVAKWRACLATGEIFEYETRVRRANGDYRWMFHRKVPLRDANGNIVKWYGSSMDVHERKAADEKIRRSEANLAEAQTLSHTGSVGMEVSTKRLFWSEESARIYGYAPGTEPTPDLILQRVHPDHVGLVKDALERAARGGDDFDFEHRLLMPDGSIKYVYNLAHFQRDEAGNEEVVGVIRDITERKVAEQAIRRSEAYLAEAQRLSHTGSFGWKPESGEIFWSDETYRIFEYDRGTKPVLEMVVQRVHPDDRNLAKQVIDGVSQTGTDFEHEYRLLMPDGRVKHVHAIARALQDASGNREFVGVVTDITERKTAEEKIRAQEMELRQMLDFTPQLVAVFGPNRERFYANRILLDYLGITLDEWWQRFDGRELAHPDDWERYTRDFDRALSSGVHLESELRVRRGDGSYRWFLARFNPVRDDTGQIRRLYVAGTDIEERKKTEERLRQENVALREEIDQASMFEEIVGESAPLREVLGALSKVAPTDSTVLITGETGTGKELVARAIHKRSQRSARAFVSVNCAAIPPSLVASELFGHEKGAFTGAIQRRQGRFEMAEGGTIFLDEVGELQPEIQIALLRILQEREFERVGSNRPIRVNVRVIAATNKDLETSVADKSFRADLFYRLNVFPLEVPPLRERREDIPLLVEYFAHRFAKRTGKSIRGIDKGTSSILESYDWPGNIRELQNVIERAVIVCNSDTLSVDERWLSGPRPRFRSIAPAPPPPLGNSERDAIETALMDSKGRVSGPFGAASRLGLPPSTLESKIKALNIEKSRFKRE